MLKSKAAVIAVTAGLALSPTLVACGAKAPQPKTTTGATSSHTQTTETNNKDTQDKKTSETKTEKTSSDVKEVTEDGAATWGAKGSDKTGDLSILYMQSKPSDSKEATATLVITDGPTNTTTYYSGTLTKDKDGTYGIKDSNTNKTVTFTLSDTDSKTQKVTITLEGGFDAELTKADKIDQIQEDINKAIEKAESQKDPSNHIKTTTETTTETNTSNTTSQTSSSSK